MNERLQGIDGLPQGLQPSLAPLSTAIGEIYRYRLAGPGLDPTERAPSRTGWWRAA